MTKVYSILDKFKFQDLKKLQERKGYLTREDIFYLYRCNDKEEVMFLIKEMLFRKILIKASSGFMYVFYLNEDLEDE